MDKKRVRIREAATMLGVSTQTLRNWEKLGKLIADRSEGQHRYYSVEDLQRFLLDIEKLGWAWVKSNVPPIIPPEYYCERPDRFTSRVAKMGLELQQSTIVTEDIASLLTLVVGEIGDNSFAHNVGSWPDTLGIFFAYDIGRRVVVLADRGRGVRATLERVRPSIVTDIDALTIAFTEIVSGRNPEKRGNGLKVVRSVAESTSIGLEFQSGIGSVRIPKGVGPMRVQMASENIRGTYAVISF